MQNMFYRYNIGCCVFIRRIGNVSLFYPIAKDVE